MDYLAAEILSPTNQPTDKAILGVGLCIEEYFTYQPRPAVIAVCNFFNGAKFSTAFWQAAAAAALPFEYCSVQWYFSCLQLLLTVVPYDFGRDHSVQYFTQCIEVHCNVEYWRNNGESTAGTRTCRCKTHPFPDCSTTVTFGTISWWLQFCIRNTGRLGERDTSFFQIFRHDSLNSALHSAVN